MNSISPVIHQNNFTFPTLSTRGNVALAFITLLMTAVLLMVINKPQLFASLFGRAQRLRPQPNEEQPQQEAQPQLSPYDLGILSNDPPDEFNLKVLHEKLDIRTMDGVVGIPQPGLNMLGICRTKGCANEGKLALVPTGFKPNRRLYGSLGYFEISITCSHSSCSLCKQIMDDDDVNDLVITSAHFRINSKFEGHNFDGAYSVPQNQTLRMHVRQFSYLHIEIQPLNFINTKLL